MPDLASLAPCSLPECTDACHAATAQELPTACASKLLGQPLDEHEVATLKEMAARHHHADFRRRALGLLLALNRGYKVVQMY